MRFMLWALDMVFGDLVDQLMRESYEDGFNDGVEAARNRHAMNAGASNA